MRKKIPCFAPVVGWGERSRAVDHYLHDEYFTSGKAVYAFEKEFVKRFGLPFGVMVNSGSSALLACMQVMRWKAGDKIIIPAANFPAAASWCQMLKLHPVFVDCELGTYNTTPQMIEDAIKNVGGVQGMVLPHTLGNPLDPEVWKLSALTVEDACDAYGSSVDGKSCGTFGLTSAFSFYPAHMLCTIEGGLAATFSAPLFDHMRSFVSWGRDCKCAPGEDDRCGNRFGHEVDGVPYDHKYISAHAGGNFKPIEVQGIFGLEQLKSLNYFISTRKRNFELIYKQLEDMQDDLILPISNGDVAWFGFPITLKRGDRTRLVGKLESRQPTAVQTRLLFAGNLTRHPFMKEFGPYSIPYRLYNSDVVMEKTIIVGCGQSLTEQEAHYISKAIKEEIKA